MGESLIPNVWQAKHKIVANRFQDKNGANLDKAEGQEGNVVGAEEGVEQDFFDAPVKVALQLLHFCPN